MLGKFYVITLNCSNRSVPNEAIERALEAYDWLRFAPDSYYVYTYTQTAETIYRIIKPILNEQDLILVGEIAVANRHGWASSIAVEWFQKPRD